MRSKIEIALVSAIGILLGSPSRGFVALAPTTLHLDRSLQFSSPFLAGKRRPAGQERWAHRKGSGSGGSEEDGDKDYQDAFARNRKRTDVHLFLTQRAIQSFAHLLMETRDPHTVRWITVRRSDGAAKHAAVILVDPTFYLSLSLSLFLLLDTLRRPQP